MEDALRRFVAEVLCGMPRAKAYRLCFPGSPPPTAAALTRLWQSPATVAVREELCTRLRNFSESGVSLSAQLQEVLLAIAHADTADYVEISGGEATAVATGSLTSTQRMAIASIKETSNGAEVKLYDKLKAVELLGKSCGLFTERATAPPVFQVEISEVADPPSTEGREEA